MEDLLGPNGAGSGLGTGNCKVSSWRTVCLCFCLCLCLIFFVLGSNISLYPKTPTGKVRKSHPHALMSCCPTHKMPGFLTLLPG